MPPKDVTSYFQNIYEYSPWLRQIRSSGVHWVRRIIWCTIIFLAASQRKRFRSLCGISSFSTRHTLPRTCRVQFQLRSHSFLSHGLDTNFENEPFQVSGWYSTGTCFETKLTSPLIFILKRNIDFVEQVYFSYAKFKRYPSYLKPGLKNLAVVFVATVSYIS